MRSTLYSVYSRMMYMQAKKKNNIRRIKWNPMVIHVFYSSIEWLHKHTYNHVNSVRLCQNWLSQSCRLKAK